MKKTIIGLAIMTAFTAQAQTTTTSLPADAASTAPGATAAPSPTQTMTTSLNEQNSFMKKMALSAYFNLMVDATQLNYSQPTVDGETQDRKDTDIYSENYFQAAYKLTDDTKIGLRHNFAWTMAGANNGKYALIDPGLVLSTKGAKYGNFEPLAANFIYYVPVTDASKDSHRLGVLRADISADYNLTTKLVGNLFTSPRLTINTSANDTSSDGSDSSLRFIAGAAATYNFNDMFNAYYAPYVDFTSTQFNRGRIEATGKLTSNSAAGKKGDLKNFLIHEVGAGMNVTKTFSVTPAVINYVSMNTGEGFGREESMEYDLYVSASF
jgi:hypothetical protein